MQIRFPSFIVRSPRRYGNLSVFPLTWETRPASPLDYDLASEAIAQRTVAVEEISEAGSVPELRVTNDSDVPVLFIEGEQLVGAKQNRILNTSLLVAAHSTAKIPVSCCEQGRWRRSSRGFKPTGTHSTTKMRRTLKTTVARSARARRGHRSDQGAVWKEVADLHAAHKTSSPTGAMEDAFAAKQEQLAECLEELKYNAPADGLAVAVGKNVVAVDVFDKPATCRKLWKRLLSGFVMDAILEPTTDDAVAEVRDVRRIVSDAYSWDWEAVEIVGMGQEHRNDRGFLLIHDDTLIHGSLAV